MKKLKKIGLLAILAIGLVLSAYGVTTNVEYDTMIFRQKGKISIVIRPKTAEITIATFDDSTAENFSDQEISILYNKGTVKKSTMDVYVLADIWTASLAIKEVGKKYQLKNKVITEIDEPKITHGQAHKSGLLFVFYFAVPLSCAVALGIISRRDKRRKLLFFFGGSLIMLIITILIGQYANLNPLSLFIIGVFSGAAGFFLGNYVKEKIGGILGFIALMFAGLFTGMYVEAAVSAQDFQQIWLYLAIFSAFCLLSLGIREGLNALSSRAQVKRAKKIIEEIGN